MAAKSRNHKGNLEHKRLSLQDQAWIYGPGFHPHILYANLRFDSDVETKEAKQFIDWCQSMRRDWGRQRILKYLRLHQSRFRACLRWLVEDALVDFNEFQEEIGRNSEPFDESELLKLWRREPQAEFLQLHGLSHSEVSIQPKFGPSESGEWFFSGIDLGPRRPRDPVDVICWHLLYLLMRDGDLKVRECKNCERFFRPRTVRKQYCSDLCRAKAHAKTPAEWREYMRGYRRDHKRLEAAKDKREVSHAD